MSVSAKTATTFPDRAAMTGSLRKGVDFLLRWQIGVNAHVEDYRDEQRGWIKRPCMAWACGSFAGDWFRNAPGDEDGNVWRMGPGLTWHTGQTLAALCEARKHLCGAGAEAGIDRALREGGRFLVRMQLDKGKNRGAFWTPPHSLPPEWRKQLKDTPLYLCPWKWQLPGAGVMIINSDMCELIAGLLDAGMTLGDDTMIDACRRWGEWQAREADCGVGRCHHDINTETGRNHERDWFWPMDDGVQGLLGARFGQALWIERYIEKVRVLIETPIDLGRMPAQQGRTFYWNSSLLLPIVQGVVKVDASLHSAALAKYVDYATWMLGLLGHEGMLAFKYERPGVPDWEGQCGGDGAATAMASRMCWVLYRATGEARWRDAAGPMLRWIIANQYDEREGDLAGGVPFCRFIRAPGSNRPFEFKRLISTTFAVRTLGEWVGGDF